MTPLLVAVWIGIESLSLNPVASYDYTGQPDTCSIEVLCGPGLDFVGFSTDIADLGLFSGVSDTGYGVTAWQNGTLLDNLSYNTGTGYEWTPADPGHFLFLLTSAGEMFAAIEDLPAVWNGIPSDLDYNDALYRIEPMTTTPEPGSLLMLGSGLAFVARRLRRKRST
ncbi:MAG: PEP-CTERM sorting domain-containing protein [Actinobacteria bacterium]|nr:PEP-CTERM sorting domain-containing protein [Actinomycetota bacterium]